MLFLGSCSNKVQNENDGKVHLITLDPGHFHAALVQKNSYPDVSDDVYVYAPDGDDLNEHLKKIEAYNTRAELPAKWNEIVYRGADFLDKMIAEKKGNLMVTAGNNRLKTDYIKKILQTGINVLADKPMAINANNFEVLKECFDIAKEKNILLYDIMTERYEITTILQKEFSQIPAVYGEQLPGSAKDPAIVKESVHHFFKYVSGAPLKRPAWFFDVEQQGEGVVDVTTHLVDLVQWEAFPGVIIDYNKDIEMVDANHWTTPITIDRFKEVTGLESFPDYLKKDLDGDVLKVYCNGDIFYKIKDVYAKVSVIWNYTFPEGGGDTHYSIMKGSKSNLVILQGKEQNYKPELFIEPVEGVDLKTYETELEKAVAGLSEKYQEIAIKKINNKSWKIEIPERYRVGHEAHFGQVTENFLKYLKEGALPEWEAPNMIAKYYVTTKALEMAKQKTK
jgi:predicted dehydrogenase